MREGLSGCRHSWEKYELFLYFLKLSKKEILNRPMPIWQHVNFSQCGQKNWSDWSPQWIRNHFFPNSSRALQLKRSCQGQGWLTPTGGASLVNTNFNLQAIFCHCCCCFNRTIKFFLETFVKVAKSKSSFAFLYLSKVKCLNARDCSIQ